MPIARAFNVDYRTSERNLFYTVQSEWEAGIPGPRESTDYIACSRWLILSHGFINETNKVAYPIAQWN